MLDLKITLDPDMEKTLAYLSTKAAAEVAEKALWAAFQPAVRCMTMYAESSRRTGTLIKSLGIKVKKYRGGKIVFALAGPVSGIVGPDGEKPTHYAHLVEFGHVTKKGKVGAKPFMRHAWEATKDEVFKIAGNEFGMGIELVVRQRRATTAARAEARKAA